MKKLIILLVVLFPVMSFAGDATYLLDGGFNANSKEERVEVASGLSDEIDKLRAYVPTPKPSEIEWVKSEEEAIEKIMKTGENVGTQRIINLYTSPEWNHELLYSTLSNIQSSLDCLKNPKVSLKNETLCWAVTAHNISNRHAINGPIGILVKDKRLPKDISDKTFLSTKEDYSFLLNILW